MQQTKHSRLLGSRLTGLSSFELVPRLLGDPLALAFRTVRLIAFLVVLIRRWLIALFVA